MANLLSKATDAIFWFIENYGLHAVCLLAGFLLGLIWWAFKHPEDFFGNEEEDETNNEVRQSTVEMKHSDKE